MEHGPQIKLPATLLLVFVAMMTGCGGVPNPKDLASDLIKDNPPTLQAAIIAGPELNVRSDGVATSAVVHLLELSDTTEFMQQDFFSIVRSAQAVLGDSLLNVKEHVLLPGQTLVLESRELTAGTTHIGVVADFRDYQDADWRQLVALTQDKTTRLKISVDRNTIHATEESRRWWRKLQKN